jgi:2-C-methyl-D-erythritol 4-phosphate cytidylyltransferase
MSDLKQNTFAAVITAGGSGSRFGAEEPKQFLDLFGYPMYIWSILNCVQLDVFEAIILTLPEPYIDRVKVDLAKLAAQSNLPKVVDKVQAIAGGPSRQMSVYLALEFLSKLNPQYVLVHDAARPFAGVSSFRLCLETLVEKGACSIGTPVSDTIKRVEGEKIVETLDRSKLWSVQTPQGAPFPLLLDCHRRAFKDGISVTDDAAILESYGNSVFIFQGSNQNIKVTLADDFKTCQLLAPLYLSKSPMEP